MKYMKMLGLLAMAAAALMAFAGTASATELYSGATTQKAGTVLDFSLKSGTSTILKETSPPNGEGETIDTCTNSTIQGKITNAGSSTTTMTGENTSITWGGCTFPTTTTKLGKFQLHWTSGVNGTVASDQEIAVTINTIFFGSCIYAATAGTSLGTLTGGNPATFHANATVERFGESIICPKTAIWTGTYVTTSPAQMEVRAS
jgi:hypothetical protein